MNKIVIQNVEYPCGMTMGALLRFKQETGRDISETGGTSSEMITLLWCCIKSACSAQKLDFPYSLLDFADACDLKTLDDFNKSVAQSGTGSKKK